MVDKEESPFDALDELLDDGAVTALDAVEVQELFAALRDSPQALADLADAYEQVKNQLTPDGREAYERELARFISMRPSEPRNLAELSDGEYGVLVESDEDLGGLARLHCLEGKRTLSLPLGALGETSFPLDELGRVRGAIAREQVQLEVRGAVAVRDGYLLLEVFVDGTFFGRKLRTVLHGTGEARSGHA